MEISMKVNGKAVSQQVETRTLLVEFLRENLTKLSPLKCLKQWVKNIGMFTLRKLDT